MSRGLVRVPCPHCGSGRTCKNGHARGRQLRLCLGCGRHWLEGARWLVEPPRACPRCGGLRTKKDGWAEGWQMYWCHGCRRHWTIGRRRGGVRERVRA